jgi:uncharacterized protein YfaS (alpha-2-macroglobulin family)
VTHPPLLALLALACHTPDPLRPADGTTSAGAPPSATPSFTVDETKKGLGIRLYDASPPREGAAGAPVAMGEPLSDDAARKLLARVPTQLVQQEGDRKAFALRPATTPPPRTGAVELAPFPPPPGGPPPAVAAGAPKLVRHAPDGEVPMAPNVSLTFDQPMVALTSQDEAARRVPAVMEPEVPGRWRWLGTKTLLFDADPRLPMATEFVVRVPKGTQSASGTALGEEVRFTFATPPAQLQHTWPSEYEPQALEPVVAMHFDQRMDPDVVLEHLVVQPSARFRLATEAERATLPPGLLDAWERAGAPGSTVFLRPVEPLARATSYALTVKAGTPSGEGPRPTTADQSARIHTYGPMNVTQHHCWWQDPCPPTAPWTIQYSNPLDLQSFDASKWTVSPAVPGLSIVPGGDSVSIGGAFTGRTAYELTVPAGVKDVFGQVSSKAETFTFRVGPAEKTLSSPGSELVVLDPQAGNRLSVFSVNHPRLSITVNAVDPEDWPKWQRWLEKFWYDDAKPGPLPGSRLSQRVVETDGEADHQTETAIELGPLLGADGVGHVLVMIEPTVQPRDRWNRQYVFKWVQVTKLGLVAMSDHDDVVAWAQDLATGAPVDGVELTLGASHGTTDAMGLAELDQPPEHAQLLVARKGDDVAFLADHVGPYGGDNGGWIASSDPDRVAWYVADDRGLYKPGESAKLKGWVRAHQTGPEGDVGRLKGDARRTVTWSLTSVMGKSIGTGTTTVSALGGFSIDVPIPADADLGPAQLQLSVDGTTEWGTNTSHTLQIQEFRRPEFEVAATMDEGPHALGLDARVDLTAAYYAGGGLPNADTTWSVFAEPSHYVPPGRQDWQFGTWTPWWIESSLWATRSGGAPLGEGFVGNLQAKTDAAGEHHLGMHFESMNPPRPMSVRAEATVMDVNRQAWTATARTLVHPADRYVGLKSEKSYVEQGKEVPVDLVVVDLDGKPATAASLDVRMARLVYKQRSDHTWGEVEDTVVPCQPTVDAEQVGHCTFKPEAGGSYRVVARVTDASGRPNESELRVWVTGEALVPSREVELEQLTLVPEARELGDGDVARVLVQAPFWPAEGVWTVRREGIERATRFTMDGPSATLEVPVDDGLVPNFSLDVHLVGAALRLDDEGKVAPELPRRVAHANGSVAFDVPPRKRTLQVTATPAVDVLAPGGATSVDVVVKAADGSPVAGAEVAVVVVDESVLALTGYELPDPLALFYAPREPGVRDAYLRSFVALGNPATVVATPSPAPAPMQGDAGFLGGLGAVGGGMGGGGVVAGAPAAAPMEMDLLRSVTKEEAKKADATVERRSANQAVTADPAPSQAAVALRTEFGALALFAPDVRTDAQGRARVDVKLPDSLTRYRVMVVAADTQRSFGSTDAAITARLPLMVRPSAPRFLNFGDQAELPFVVQNQTDRDVVVDVALQATHLALVDRVEAVFPDLGAPGAPSVAGRRVKVPANDRVEVRFPAATLGAGTARLQVVAAAGDASDAAELSFPVWTPATTEAFATYGSLDAGATVQPVEAPPDSWVQFGGLEVTTSSTQLQALTDAVLYLQSYPYDCNEQMASRVLAIASLRDVLSAFDSPDLPPAAALEGRVKADLQKLADRQHWNGGWSFWRKGDETWPYLSIYVADAYARAKAKGYDVPDHSFRQAANHLQNIEGYIPYWYGPEERAFLRAFAIDVLRRMGEPDVREAREVWRETESLLGIDGMAFLLPTLHEGGARAESTEILHRLSNQVTEEAGTAHFVTSYSDGAHVLLHSDRRADGIVLEALMETAPDDELVEKVVRGLLAHRKKGHWLNTQEDAFVLMALDRYFRTYEKETPDFVAKVWLGDGFVGDHAFRGRTTEYFQADVPMGYLTENRGPVPLTLAMDGDAGRLYYRVGLRYAPRDLRLPPADYGFAVERKYVGIDDPGDVRLDDDGVWHVKAGARIKVELDFANESRRYHVALVDPLPAGFEAQNPVLATTGTLPQSPPDQQPYWWWWSRPWQEHEMMRDERVEVFTSLLWDGVHSYDYVARATTPGRFVVPPTKAEEMYMPETFGRSGTDIVVVE